MEVFQSPERIETIQFIPTHAGANDKFHIHVSWSMCKITNNCCSKTTKCSKKKKKARKCVSGNVKETFKKNGKNECCKMWVVKTVRGRGESS